MSERVFWCDKCMIGATYRSDLDCPHPGGVSHRDLVSPEFLRPVLLAAVAWLHEHDLNVHANLMDGAIDRDVLAACIDALSVEGVEP